MRALYGTGLPQDRADNTKLTLLADKIRLLSKLEERNAYVRAIQNCAGLIDGFSAEKIRNLNKLVTLAELSHREYAHGFLVALNKLERIPENIEKRAELFRLVGESGMKLNANFIFNEMEIKDIYPWYWIDVAAHVSWKLTRAFVKEWLKVHRDLSPILPRLFIWKGLYEDKEVFRKMLAEIMGDIKPKKRQANFIEAFFESW